MPTWIALLAAGLLKLVAMTYRVRIVAPKTPIEILAQPPLVIPIWHNRILFYAPLIPRHLLQHCTALISASRDGEYISTFIRFFGLHVVRGSSSRGGAQALVDLIHAAKQGYNPILAVDGPRGPKYTVHPGAVAIAWKNQIPLVPFMLNAKHKWQLKSWDGLQIPVPFSKVDLVVGEAFTIPQDISSEEACEMLRQHLMAITED